ncbi:hypothetical protein Enr8_44800 [Blastopirellula retiformator]|uniref:Uncharacterized protein n=1 Tax=Blastopirellula retiformator TaxID=2527970 RepID=A0A5C5UWS7_9BACT|nr:hypothetical protein Enr8_44800 [Blastopirellula retiformator]
MLRLPARISVDMAASRPVLAPTDSGSLTEFENSAYPDSFDQSFAPYKPSRSPETIDQWA